MSSLHTWNRDTTHQCDSWEPGSHIRNHEPVLSFYRVISIVSFTLTSNDQVCIWEKALSLHQRSGVAWVENVKDAICIHPHRSVSWEETQQTVLNGKRGDLLSEIKRSFSFSPSKNENKTWGNLLIWYWPQLLRRSVLCKGSPENTRCLRVGTQETDPFFIFPHCLFCSCCEEALRFRRGAQIRSSCPQLKHSRCFFLLYTDWCVT